MHCTITSFPVICWIALLLTLRCTHGQRAKRCTSRPPFGGDWGFHCFDGIHCLDSAMTVCESFFGSKCPDNSDLDDQLCSRKVRMYTKVFFLVAYTWLCTPLYRTKQFCKNAIRSICPSVASVGRSVAPYLSSHRRWPVLAFVGIFRAILASLPLPNGARLNYLRTIIYNYE